MQIHYLERLFAPRSVAVVGASERAGSLGRFAFDNLLAGGYGGELVAINPKYRNVGGRPCHAAEYTTVRPSAPKRAEKINPDANVIR